MINNLLANAVGYLNALLAILFVVVGAIAYGLGGAILGFFLAAISCGVIALIIDMRTELRRIREALERLAALPRTVP